MDQQKFNAAVKEFKESTHNWVKIARLLVEAYDQGENLNGIEGIGNLRNNLGRLISAYRFLDLRRPEALKDPKKMNVSFRGFSSLPLIYSRLNPETRETEIEKILDKVLTGDLTAYETEVLSAKLAGKPYGNLGIKKVDLTDKDSNNVKEVLEKFNIYLNEIIAKYDYEVLRGKFSSTCDTIATKLNCIADPGYKKMWEERREVQI
jgi:hypothetical protein